MKAGEMSLFEIFGGLGDIVCEFVIFFGTGKVASAFGEEVETGL